MVERTEEAGISGLLHLTMGGRNVDLPVLVIEQSERWQRLLGAQVANTQVPDVKSGAAMFGELAAMPSAAMRRLVVAYETLGVCPETCPNRGVEPGPEHEHTGALGGDSGVIRRMTQAEVYDATQQMIRAEYPFVMDLRSAVAAFGPQIQATISMGLMELAERYLTARPTPTPSDAGGSTPGLFAVASPASSSSSSGSTTRKRNGASPSPA